MTDCERAVTASYLCFIVSFRLQENIIISETVHDGDESSVDRLLENVVTLSESVIENCTQPTPPSGAITKTSFRLTKNIVMSEWVFDRRKLCGVH